ncbi:MAG: RHS repeat-associated core domain-containing protein, partial [Anaerolineae bacterium]
TNCRLPLDVYLTYNSQDAQIGGMMRLHGWRFPHDIHYQTEENGAVSFYWSGGASVRFEPVEGGGFEAPPGVTDKLTSPQPGQYVLTTCANMIYYFDSPRHRRVSRIEASNGQALALLYDATNKLVAVRDPYGRQITLTYDAAGYLTQVTDPNVTPARTVHYAHDAAGNLTSVVDPLGHTTTFSYDGDHRLVGVRDPKGNSLQIAYNGDGMVSSVGSPLSARTFAYDEQTHKTTVVDMVSAGESRQTVYFYDERGRLTELQRDDGLSRTIAWDEDDNPVRVTDEAGRTTHYTFDGRSNVTSVTDPLSRKVTMTYHPTFGEMTSFTDPLGRVTTWEYDTHGNLVSVTEPGNRLTTFEYDDLGWHMTSMTDPLNRTTLFDYDQLGNNTVITDATGAVMTFTYDAIGRMLSATDDNGHSTTYAYDAAGRVTAITDPLNRATGIAYDAGGNPAQITNAAGGIRTYRFDSLNRLLDITDEIGGGTTYGYNGVGNTISVADAHARAVSYEYDSRDRLIGETDPSGHKTTFEYDAVGQLQHRQDPDGQVSTYDYDLGGQLAVADYPGDNEAFAYDDAGNVVAITSTHVIMRYAYNATDEPTAITMTVPGLVTKTVSYTYYADGSRESMTDPDGGVTTYTYDDRGRIRTITNPALEVVTYTWDGAGRLTRKDLGNGTYVEYGYDDASQLLSMAHRKAGGDLLGSFAYTYDDLGNRLSEARGDGSQVTYTYDARSRLIGASYSDGTTIEYAYDLAGHRTQMVVDGEATSYTVDAAGRLQSDGSASFHWDGQGNLSTVENGGGITTYTFDSRHRMTGVSSPADGTTAFEFYPDGRRLSRTDPDGTLTFYVYDGPNLLMELDEEGQTVARYTSGDMDDWLSMERDGQRYTYHADVLGSIVQLTDAGGSLVEAYRYSPFGRTGVVDGAGQPIAESAVGNPFRFTGRQFLGLGELYDYRARVYDPATGRFLSEDTAEAARDPNRYAYALNNPATLVDPTGEDTWVGQGTGLSAGFLFGCKVWSGTVMNLATGEQCRIRESCCSLGAQAHASLETGLKMFTGPSKGNQLNMSKWSAEIGGSIELGALEVSAGFEVNTEDGESYTKAGLGAGGLSAQGAASSRGNLSADAVAKVGAGFSAAKGEYCKRSVLWCDKKEEDEPDPPPDPNCDSDTGCCRVGPGCGSDEEGETECCFTCCDGPCDVPECDTPTPWDPPFPGLPPWGPGYDHPDENVSAASAQLLSSIPVVRREQGYIGLLWRGYARSTGVLINRAGERYEPVGLTFSPELARRLPVLVVPSGALYGLENLDSFKAQLAAYVEQGGTIISFAQQQGTDFSTLPAPAGEEPLGGYGWREDNSCFETAFYISNYHPVVSGFAAPTLDVHVDGYFATAPGGATELLNRMKNGQPGLLLYRYPSETEGGYVMATTVYDDWGETNFQASRDALVLLRDMLSWAFEPEEILPEYGPGDAIDLPITVQNGTGQEAASVDLLLLGPNRQVAHTQSVAVPVPIGGSIAPSLTWTLPDPAQLGIWWVEYILRDAGGAVLQEETVGRRLVVSDPSPITGPDRPLSMWVTAPTEHYLSGTEAEFTFHVLNHTDVLRSVEIRYGLPHHTWETGDLSYGNFHDLSYTMDVGPGDTATYLYTPTIYTTDRLWASLYEGTDLRDNAHFSIWHVSPAVRLDLETGAALYLPEDTVAVTVTVQNLESAPYTMDTRVEIWSANGYLVHQADFSSPLDGEGSATLTTSYSPPADAVRGFYKVLAETYHDGARGASETTRFEVPPPDLRITPLEPAAYLPNAANPVQFRIENHGLGAATGGVFDATLRDPTGSQIWSGSQGFAVAQGDVVTLTFPITFNEQFGTYHLGYRASANGLAPQGRLDIRFANLVDPRKDQRQYSAGQTMGLDVGVTNSGRFEENLDVLLEVPAAGYSQTNPLGPVAPGEMATDTHTVSLPATLTAGSYPFTITLSLGSGSQEQWHSSFSVPPSRLALSSPPDVTAGEVHTVTVSNAGGSEAGATYDWTLKAGTQVENVQGTIATLGVGESADVPFTVPAGAVSGLYYLRGPMTNTQTGQSTPVAVPLNVSGVDASLDVRTDQPVYASSDPVNATATITGTGAPDSGANLHLEIRAPAGGEEWITHMPGDHGPLDHPVKAMAVDGAGLKWFASYAGVVVMDDGGTPLDKSDDLWQGFTYRDGLGNGSVSALAIDGYGFKWVAHLGGFSVLDDGGTPFEKSDDLWITFDSTDQPLINGVQVIVMEGSNLVWFGTGGGLVVLDHGGTPFDKGDDQWQSYTTADGGLKGDNHVYSIAIDAMGYKWIGTYNESQLNGALNVFDDNGTPLIKDDGDRWQFFDTVDGLSHRWVNAIAIDDAGLKWIATYSRLNVLDDKGDPFDKLDGDVWVKFELADGLPYLTVRNIVIDAAGYKWLNTYNSNYLNPLGALAVLDDKGTPLDKNGDVWTSFTTTDGLVHVEPYSLMLPGGDQVWIGTRQGLNALDHGGTPFDKGDDGWQRFTPEDGLVEPWVLTVAQDEGGRKWLGGGGAGLYVLDEGGTPLDKSDDVWMSFTLDDGLISEEVYSIAPDGAGSIWIATREGLNLLDTAGTPFDKSDDHWQTWDANDDWVFQIVYAVALDDQGYTWIGGEGGAGVLDVGGTPFEKADDVWQTFTEADGLPYDEIRAIVIDEGGYKWLGVAWDGAYVLDDGGTPFDKADDDLEWFPAGDGLITDITIDGEGNKWLVTTGGAAVVDDNGTPMNPLDDQYESYWLGEGYANHIVAVAADAGGDIWFGTWEGVRVLDHGGTPFDQDDDTWRVLTTADGLLDDRLEDVAVYGDVKYLCPEWGGLHVLAKGSRLLWEVDAAAGLVGIIQITEPVGIPDQVGKLTLHGVLTSTTNQVIARDAYPFYIFDTDAILTMETDQPFYRPGETIAISGEVRNDGDAPLSNQTLTIVQDGNTILEEGPFDVPAHGNHPYATSTTAPDTPGTTRLAASMNDVTVEDEVQVVQPQVEATLQAPDLAGSQPFTVTVVLTNSGEIEATVHVSVQGHGDPVAVPVGETRLVQRAVQITEDTTVSAVLSGDLDQTLSHDVVFGEAAESTFYPPQVSCPGPIEISYVLTNTGQLEAEFTTMVTLTGSLAPILGLQIDSYLPVSATQEGALAAELIADDYTLNWRHPYGSGQVGLAVTAKDQLTLEAIAGASDGVQAPVTVTLTNVGCNPFSGTLTVEAEAGSGIFYGDQQPVEIELAGSGVYTFALDTAGLAPGVYTATLALGDGSGGTVGTTSVSSDLPGSDLHVSALPLNTTLVASQTVTLTFGIENLGAIGDQASLTFSLGDLEDETQIQWLDPAETGVLTYTFFVPPDLTSGDYLAAYALTGMWDPSGENGDLVFQVEGISLTVEAETDQPAYLEGDPAQITLTIGNGGAADTGDLAALVAFNGITQTQTFSLSPGASLPLDFVVEASFAGDTKVFYGVYDADTDRSIYLDTLYLRQQHPRLTLLPDKQVYRPGETVVATLVTTLTQGTLDIFAPGYAGDLAIADGNQVTFALPDPLARGTYALYYVTSGSGTEEDGRERFSAFDVDGPKVFVPSAALRQETYRPDDTLELDLTLSSDRAVEATLRSYIAYPDRSAGQIYSQPVLLGDSVANHLVATAVLSGTQMGPHQMRYQLLQESARGDVILAEGSEPFDVGPAALRRVNTDQESYTGAADTVQARLDLYSRLGGPAQVTLHLDQGPATEQG